MPSLKYVSISVENEQSGETVTISLAMAMTPNQYLNRTLYEGIVVRFVVFQSSVN